MHDLPLENLKTLDNVSCRLGDDIAGHLVAEASVYISSTGFSLSAFEHLAEETIAGKEFDKVRLVVE